MICFVTNNDFTFETPDEDVAFRVDTLIEDKFDVNYVDDWNVGREFSIYGPVIGTSTANGKPWLTFLTAMQRSRPACCPGQNSCLARLAHSYNKQ